MSDLRVNAQTEIQQIEKIREYQKNVEERRRERVSKKGDAVEISEKGKLLSAIAKIPDIRIEKVEEIKQKIKEGTYVNDENLKEALKALIEDL